jgi:hypothetical protein
MGKFAKRVVIRKCHATRRSLAYTGERGLAWSFARSRAIPFSTKTVWGSLPSALPAALATPRVALPLGLHIDWVAIEPWAAFAIGFEPIHARLHDAMADLALTTHQ